MVGDQMSPFQLIVSKLEKTSARSSLTSAFLHRPFGTSISVGAVLFAFGWGVFQDIRPGIVGGLFTFFGRYFTFRKGSETRRAILRSPAYQDWHQDGSLDNDHR